MEELWGGRRANPIECKRRSEHKCFNSNQSHSGDRSREKRRYNWQMPMTLWKHHTMQVYIEDINKGMKSTSNWQRTNRNFNDKNLVLEVNKTMNK